MKKSVLKKLLKKMQEKNISLDVVDNFLAVDESILTYVAKTDCDNIEDIISIVDNLNYYNVSSIDIIASLDSYVYAEDYQKNFIYNYLTSSIPAKGKFTLDGLNILKECPNEISSKSALNILLNNTLINKKINLSLAKVMINAETKEKVEYIENLFMGREIINTEDILKCASIIADSPSNFNARYAFLLLNNHNLKEAGKHYEAAKLINMAPNEFNARYASTILKHYACVNSDFAFMGAKLIIASSEVYQAHYAEELLSSSKIEDLENRLRSAYILTKTKNNIETSFIYKLHITEYFLRNNLAYTLSSLIVNKNIDKNIPKLKEVIDTELKLNILKEAIEKIIKPLENTSPLEYEEGIKIFNNILELVFDTNLNITSMEEDLNQNSFYAEYNMEIDSIDSEEVKVEEVRKRVLKRREEL